MKSLKVAAAFLVLALSAGPASFAQTVYVPPGDEPRFGGEFALTELGQVAGYWRAECYNWRVRSQSRRSGPLASPQVTAAFHRFVEGLIINKPDFDDMSPAMARAVRMSLPTAWPSINRMGRASTAQRFDVDRQGNALYVLNQVGGETHWNMTVNRNGKIAAAFICRGQGL